MLFLGLSKHIWPLRREEVRMPMRDTSQLTHTARRMYKIRSSASMAAAIEISKLRREGVIIHSLAIGEPDFAPPKTAINAMLDAVARNETDYLIENQPLTQAIAHRFEKNNGLKFAADEIALGAGLKRNYLRRILFNH